MTSDHDHYQGGTSHSVFFAFVVAVALFVAGFGYSIWPRTVPSTGQAMSDGSKVQRSPSPTAKTGEMPVTDKSPAPEKTPAPKPSGG
jgi:hypothetical protein